MINQADTLHISELINIAQHSGVFKIMAERRCRQVTIDYCPPREPMAIPREPGCSDPIEPITPEIIPITYTLEDAMFGGVIYVSLTCGSRVVVNPFVWSSYEHLRLISIETR